MAVNAVRSITLALLGVEGRGVADPLSRDDRHYLGEGWQMSHAGSNIAIWTSAMDVMRRVAMRSRPA